uniref:Disease resistance protein At4g27190 family n=1 Tax=Cajanus cajan TaxID=3821 RepID=A0A151U2L5_CAJCA|nr:Disease resistance protein At4g27190 family [Cajanus cajan]
MECLCGFASSVARDLVVGAIIQLRYPCCFNNFVKELAKEEDNLIATRHSVEDRIAHAKKQTRITADVVGKWIEDANIDIYNVDQLLEKARTEKSCFGHCPNSIWRYHLGKKLANKKRDIEKCIEEGKEYIYNSNVFPSGLLDSPFEKCLNFESRQRAYEQLMEALKDDGVSMIGLYGELERAKRLYMRLTQENKILVILDDVWEMLDFGAIGISSTKHHMGCKVLITTRLEAVCTLMDCQKRIHLQILTDEEAWALFQKQAHISEDTSNTLKHLAREISNECKGLPVDIAAVASSLKGKSEVIWRVAFNKFTSSTSKPINIEKGLSDPYKCLQLSYDNLDTKEAKSLFLLCAVFPEDYEIPIEELTRYAIGLGVVGEVNSYEEARNEVIAAKIKLVSSCLLLEAGDKYVKMHDLVRDVAHLIAKNENNLIKCGLDNDVTLEQISIRYLWFEKLPNDLNCSNLEFLCIYTKLEVMDEIFKRTRKLRVLILFNAWWHMLPLSTTAFKTLTSIRCLMLRNWKLSDISFVRHMRKLQSLSLYGCSLHSLLELQTCDVITQLTNWKLLVLHQCQMEKNGFVVCPKYPATKNCASLIVLKTG